jgi:pimeloyl-ACP methyl ester carboxylesterase
MLRRSIPLGVALALAACSAPQGDAGSPSNRGSATPIESERPPSATATLPPSADPVAGAFEVTVNGLAVSGRCVGEREPGEPVVVLQSGNGGGADHLAGIGDHMADAMVCAFARPGAGENPPPAELPRTVDAVVTEVHDILQEAEIEAPYFMVGQSGGGVVAFMFAQAYPDEVAGFVAMSGNPPYETWVAQAEAIGLPQSLIDGAVADFSGQNPEQIDFRTNESMLTGTLPSTMPYAIMYGECTGSACENFEVALAERLALVGGGGRFVLADGAGHEIHVTQPDLVNDTIDEVWAEATSSS